MSFVERIEDNIKLSNRYKLQSVTYGRVPTNKGMCDGVCIKISFNSLGLRDINMTIYIAEHTEDNPISSTYLESGGITPDSMVLAGVNVI